MDGTIYDDCTAPLLAFDGVPDSAWDDRAERAPRRRAASDDYRQVAVICNPRSYRNRNKPLQFPEGVRVLEPGTRPELRRVLAELSREGVELLVIAGGDGTVRDVLTCGADIWGANAPVIGVLPCGKTNALAIDLGVADDAEVSDLIDGWRNGRIAARSPIEIARKGEGKPVFGFLFGAGVFVDATELAQTTHRWGAVNNLAVGLSVFGAVASTLLGGERSPWRRGKNMAIRYGAGAKPRHGAALESEGPRFIVMASTMERLPLDAAIFGEKRAGLKALVVDAPPRRFLLSFARIMRGTDKPALERDGVHRVDAQEIAIDLEGGFVLDGERFPAGDYILRESAPVRFAIT
ncbi:diacylglycerol/lipid kinase family protein [Croceicoccus bisphenolivorans]|uniref:diacylglycerol/lipid kinase family protein n=1 Tax=Croceicoccus bisphenolivorans TaxID=1783232 RepID=UPI00156177EE|nr:diacylglycerol kinase family protein [Croceicoccus bisphenolivorans]